MYHGALKALIRKAVNWRDNSEFAGSPVFCGLTESRNESQLVMGPFNVASMAPPYGGIRANPILREILPEKK
ncbi:unnamed protein product [Schistocephalus solidus]|uniref:Aldedh domain-containing protein n=1 Tax=Schistocephalus solidus TaxID=70667 RepID=A0A183SSK0_SCHSO|nr:unnamed protein product [Schistocephalus solidus]